MDSWECSGITFLAGLGMVSILYFTRQDLAGTGSIVSYRGIGKARGRGGQSCDRHQQFPAVRDLCAAMWLFPMSRGWIFPPVPRAISAMRRVHGTGA